MQINGTLILLYFIEMLPCIVSDYVNRSLGKATKKKDPRTRPYKQGQVDLQSPDSLKHTLEWLEYQGKVGSSKSPLEPPVIPCKPRKFEQVGATVIDFLAAV